MSNIPVHGVERTAAHPAWTPVSVDCEIMLPLPLKPDPPAFLRRGRILPTGTGKPIMQASSASLLQHDTIPKTIPQPGLPTGLVGLPKQRPALARLREAMTALHIGRLCRAVSYELFTYWSPSGSVFPSVKALADGMGLKRRAVRHHIAHLERVGLWVRIGREDETNLYVLHLPGEAQEGFVKPEPRAVAAAPPARTCRPPGTHMPPEVTNEVIKEVISTSSSRARVVCKICGNNWPAEYGTDCHKCRKNPKLSTWTPADDTPTDEPTACTCGEAYRNAYGGRCVECEGEPSAAQRDALREKDDCRGEDDRVGEDGGVVRPAGPGIDAPPLEAIASTPPRAETETRQPTETRGQRPDSSVLPEDGSPPNGGEPGPNARRFFADFAQWTVGKRTRLQHGSDRRRLARTARHELADLAKGEQADDGHTTT